MSHSNNVVGACIMVMYKYDILRICGSTYCCGCVVNSSGILRMTALLLCALKESATSTIILIVNWQEGSATI